MSHGFTYQRQLHLCQGARRRFVESEQRRVFLQQLQSERAIRTLVLRPAERGQRLLSIRSARGHGTRFHTGNFVDQIIGGWYTSGIFSAWTGLPFKVTEGSQVWGGGNTSIGATDYMVPSGPLPATGVNHNVSNTTTCSNGIFSGTVGANVGGASGTNLDIFSNPGAAYCDFNYVQLSSTGRTGSGDPMHGLSFWNFDMRLGKDTKIREKDWKLGFSADFFNIFNHENFANPSTSFTSPATFGVITGHLYSAKSHQRRAMD